MTLVEKAAADRELCNLVAEGIEQLNRIGDRLERLVSAER